LAMVAILATLLLSAPRWAWEVGGEVSGEVYVCHEAPNPIR